MLQNRRATVWNSAVPLERTPKNRTIRLHVEPLEPREVPAAQTFVWIGNQDTNGNDYRNYQMADTSPATRMPTTGDRIVLNANAQRSMVITAGNTIDCDSFSIPGAKPLSQLSNPDAATKGNLYVAGTLNIRGAQIGDPNSSWQAGFVEIEGPAGDRLTSGVAPPSSRMRAARSTRSTTTPDTSTSSIRAC
jgi:hypothetical protein